MKKPALALEEALGLVDAIEVRLPTETVPLGRALGRVPASDPVSRVDQPPFDKSTMDGFAYASDGGALARGGDSFRLVGTVVAAGCPPGPRLAPGECARIMTGAPTPEGTVAVQRLELATESGGSVLVEAPEGVPNIVRRGANRPAGETMFPRRPLRAQDIGILAANGFDEIEVLRRPRVVVLSTGDELFGTGEGTLPPWRVYDSNGPQLVAQAESAGCEARFAGIVRDDEGAIVAAILEAVGDPPEGADLVILSGGVSVGDFDYVPAAAARAGFAPVFHRVAMKPGKPAFLARRGGRFLYGVPGNPLSAFVNFEVLIRPLLMRLHGLRHEPRTVRVRLGEAIARERDLDRAEFLPVGMREGLAFPLRFTGSSMLDVLATADALVRLEAGEAGAGIGEELDARLL